MKKQDVPLSVAIFILLCGLFMGSIFTFGMQFWNASILREDCEVVKTAYSGCDVIRVNKRPTDYKEIHIDCSNAQRYTIDGACINEELRAALSRLEDNEPITLLIHPNSDVIVEFRAGDKLILEFDEAMGKLEGERLGFLVLGILLYLMAFYGAYHAVSHLIKLHRGH